MELTPAGVFCGLDILLAVSQSARPDSPDLSRSWRRDACLKAAVPRRMNKASALPYPTDSLWPPAATEEGKQWLRHFPCTSDVIILRIASNCLVAPLHSRGAVAETSDSAERRVGKEWVSTFTTRGLRY